MKSAELVSDAELARFYRNGRGEQIAYANPGAHLEGLRAVAEYVTTLCVAAGVTNFEDKLDRLTTALERVADVFERAQDDESEGDEWKQGDKE